MSGNSLSVDPGLADLADQVFAAQEQEESTRSGATGAASAFDGSWRNAADAGLPWVSVPEAAGGSGGTLLDAATVAYALGARAVSLPVIETMLAGWLHAEAGLPVDQVPMSVVAAPAPLVIFQGKLTGTVPAVAWGSEVAVTAALISGPDSAPRLVTWRQGTGIAATRSDIAGQSWTTVQLDAPPADDRPLAAETPARLRDRAALLRAAAMAGAMNAVMQLTNTYCAQRTQFGKPLGAFQAVQQHLVTIAQGATTTWLNVIRAAGAVESGGGSFEAAAVKHLANEYATASVRAAQQAHGAIGLTREYPLHRYTRLLLAWRGQDGSREALIRQIGEEVTAPGDLAAVVQSRAGYQQRNVDQR
jgi:acyl-CoA dehydrogenase